MGALAVGLKTQQCSLSWEKIVAINQAARGSPQVFQGQELRAAKQPALARRAQSPSEIPDSFS